MGIENQGFEVPKVTNEDGLDNVVEQKPLEEKGFFKKIMEKCPKLGSVLPGLLMILSPNLEAGNISAEDAIKEVKNNPELVRHFNEFKEQVKKINSGVPEQATYVYSTSSASVDNKGNSFDEKVVGQLPDSMKNFVLNTEGVTRIYSGTSVDKSTDNANIFDGTLRLVFLVPAEGNIVEKGKMTVKGYGPSRDDAFRDAFRELIGTTGISINSKVELNTKTVDGGDKSSAVEGFSKNITTSGLLLIKDANVVEVGPNNNQHMDPKRNMVEVTLEIKIGAFQK